MTSATNYIEGLQQIADKAQSLEVAYRQQAAAQIALLERQRAFAFRRMNLMRSLVEAVTARTDEGSDVGERNGEEIAVASALALLRIKLGWSSDGETRDATLMNFTPVVVALYRGSNRDDQITPDGIPDIGTALGHFEDWYEKAYGVSFWMLFENPIPDTPRVDF